MAGNEVEVCRFILDNLNNIELRHIGRIKEIAAPARSGSYNLIKSVKDLSQISTSDARKKADVYLNGSGVSIKQKGASVLYNRLQRANLPKLYSELSFSSIDEKLAQIDREVYKFHLGEIPRDRLWENFFTEVEFKSLVNFLMLKGSPNYGLSKHPAEFILEAPIYIQSVESIQTYCFYEYFKEYKQDIRIAIRRSWVGQLSKSEHTRALSISKKNDNLPWVFYDIVSEPPSGWRADFPTADRRTVYYLMLTKVNG